MLKLSALALRMSSHGGPRILGELGTGDPFVGLGSSSEAFPSGLERVGLLARGLLGDGEDLAGLEASRGVRWGEEACRTSCSGLFRG